MDELDHTIIHFLQKDGRKPYTEIAQELNISEGTVRNRVGRLIEEDVLRIVGVADPAKLGYTVTAVIGISIQGDNIDQAGKQLASFPEVSDVIMVSGEYDLITLVYCRNREHLTTFINQHLRPIDGVAHTHTSVVLSTFKTTRNMRPLISY